MRIALDATYSIDPHPSGIAVYSRQLLSGLAQTYPDDNFLHCYRLKQFRKAPQPEFQNVDRRLLLPPLPSFRAGLFHALNQRVDRRPAKRIVSTFHDLFVMTGEYSSPEFRARFTKQAQRAAQNSDYIIAVSQFTANQVSSLLRFDSSRIRVIPHGVHQPSVDASRARAGARGNIILSVGALQTRKNIGRLVEAFEHVSPAWTLVLAGAPDGYQAAKIMARIHESKCRDRIRVTGYLPLTELNCLYSQASIFAFPSLDEGFGMPVLEAMSYGLPVIASNRSALAEVAGEAALLIDPHRTEELIASLQRLIHDCELRARLADLGRSRAKLYTWERAVRSTYAVYKEAAD